MKLKPCPLCGGIAEISEITQDADDAGLSRFYVVGVQIKCQRCGLLLPGYYNEKSPLDDALVNLSILWNTRPAETSGTP